MTSVADIRDLVLDKLKRSKHDGSVDARVAAKVDKAIQLKQAQLAGGEDPVAYWGADVTDMPDEALTSFVGLVAASLADAMAIGARRRQELKVEASPNLSNISDLARVHQSEEPQEALYF